MTMLKKTIILFFCFFIFANAQITVDSIVMQQAADILRNEFSQMENKSEYPAYEIYGEETPVLSVSSTYEKNDFSHKFYIQQNYRKMGIKNEAEIRSLANEDVKKFFSKNISDSVRVTRVGIEYEERNKNTRIVGAIAMLHRLVDGVPKRGESYIFMYYDSLANLKEIEMKWNKHKKHVLIESMSLRQNENIRNVIFNQKVDEINESLKREKIQGRLYNAFKSWHLKSGDNGKKLLVPSITYLGLYFENGKNRYFSFDIDIFNPRSTNLTQSEICSSK